MSGYNLDTARHKDQKQQMQDLAKRGVCAFCYENIAIEQREPIEMETDYWIIKRNDYPYEHTDLHLMMIAREHVSTFSKLSPEAQSDFGQAITAIETKYQLDSYAVGMRSGDFRYNGGSVEHLHAHIVVGKRQPEDFEAVRFKMSSLPKS